MATAEKCKLRPSNQTRWREIQPRRVIIHCWACYFCANCRFIL